MTEEKEFWIKTRILDRSEKKGIVGLLVPNYLRGSELHKIVKYLAGDEVMKEQSLSASEEESFDGIRTLIGQYIKEVEKNEVGQMRTVFNIKNKHGAYEKEGEGGRGGKAANLKKSSIDYILEEEIDIGDGIKEKYDSLCFCIGQVPVWGYCTAKRMKN